MSSNHQIAILPVDTILPNPEQPRRHFDGVAIKELADSIHAIGLQSPILVEANPEIKETYLLVSGERRLRAHRLLNLPTIQAIIRPNGTKLDLLADSLTENVQRNDMSPVEEGYAYQKLRNEHGLTVRKISLRIGVGEARIHYCLKIVDNLEPEIIDLFEKKKLPMSTEPLNALIDVPAGEIRIKFARRLANESHQPSIKSIVMASRRLVNSLNSSKEYKSRDEAPAFSMVKKDEHFDKHLPAWDVFCQARELPPFPLFQASVRKTCNACALREVASPSTCSQCPLAQMVSELMEHVHVA